MRADQKIDLLPAVVAVSVMHAVVFWHAPTVPMRRIVAGAAAGVAASACASFALEWSRLRSASAHQRPSA